MISALQNENLQIRRLAAQRALYAVAKSVLVVQWCLACPVVVAWSILVGFCPETKAYGALWGLAVAFADTAFLEPWSQRLRRRAALIQESFDSHVLGLPWNKLKAGRKPDPELIEEYARKFEKRSGDISVLANWYPTIVSQLPLHVGRVVCQRSNLWWDAKLRRRYAAHIVVLVCVVLAGALCLAMSSGKTVESLVLGFGAIVMPTVLFGVRQYRCQRESATRLDRLKEESEKLWDEALTGLPEAQATAWSRNLQDEILENRRTNVVIFDWVYQLLRSDYETQMNRGADQLVAEAKAKLGIS